MAHLLDSANLKLGRANRHAEGFNREVRIFFDKKPYLLLPNAQPDIGKYSYRIKVRREFPTDSLGLVLGDAIHCYRSALDHVAWQLALGYSPNIPDGDTRTQFPVESQVVV